MEINDDMIEKICSNCNNLVVKQNTTRIPTGWYYDSLVTYDIQKFDIKNLLRKIFNITNNKTNIRREKMKINFMQLQGVIDGIFEREVTVNAEHYCQGLIEGLLLSQFYDDFVESDLDGLYYLKKYITRKCQEGKRLPDSELNKMIEKSNQSDTVPI